MTTEILASDYPQTLTGFDEIAIATHFGAKLMNLRDDPFTFLRALVFVDQRRQGLKDKEAYQAAMEMTNGQCNDYFPDEPENAKSDEGEDPKA